MNSLVFFICSVLALIAISTSVFIGLRLNKWWHWLIVLCGFLSGFLFPLGLPQGHINRNIHIGLFSGFIFSFFVILSGRREYKNKLKTKSIWKSLFDIDNNES